MKRTQGFSTKLLRKYKTHITANTIILLLIATFQINSPLILRQVTGLINDNAHFTVALAWFFISFPYCI